MQVPMTPMRFLNRTVQLYPEKSAVVCGGTAYSYRTFNERVNQFSHALQEKANIQKGDRVAYLALNCHRLVEGYYAVPQIGAVLLCLNIRLNPEEIVYILNDATPKVLVLSHMMVPLWDKIKPSCPSIQTVLLMEGPMDGRTESGMDDFIIGEPTAKPQMPDIDENDTAELFYTSGTTGKPKGVMLTYRNLYSHALSAIVTLKTDDHVVQIVGTVPLFHVNSWGSPHYLVAVGATQVVVPKFDPKLFSEAVHQYKATHALLVPTMFNDLLNFPELDQYDMSSLEMVVLGGAPAPYALVEAGRKKLNCQVLVGYGMTETTPIVSVAVLKGTLRDRPQEEKDHRQAMTGIPVIGVEVEIFDDEGKALPHDGKTKGELCVRGDIVMKGYWNKPEETESAFRNGWLKTGDVAVIDEEGYINIVDRKKDVIISGGENISSVEVEDVLYKHPAVLEAAVIGVPDPKWGETVKALVVLKPGQQATEEKIITFCRQHLAGFKIPRSVDFLAELPKTGTGKIMKHKLRETYWEGHDSLVR